MNFMANLPPTDELQKKDAPITCILSLTPTNSTPRVSA